MTDLMSQEDVDLFREAMRDVTDTFHRSRVVLRRASGEELELHCGLKPAEGGADGETNGERYQRESRSETVERWVISFNRDYLKEKGLVEDDRLLISADQDWILIDGKRFAIVALTDKGVFRGSPVMTRLTVAR